MNKEDIVLKVIAMACICFLFAVASNKAINIYCLKQTRDCKFHKYVKVYRDNIRLSYRSRHNAKM